MTPAIVPVKPLRGALGRLAGLLDPPARRELQMAMLTDVLSALLEANTDAICVTGDGVVAALAGAIGARVVPDRDPPGGIDAAVRIGLDRVAGAPRALVVMGDLPLASATDITRLLSVASPDPGVTLVPSRDETGTNAVLLRPPHAIDPAFGPGSFARHIADAGRRGIPVARVECPGLALDVDTPQDLIAVISSTPPSRTRRVCEELGVLEWLASPAG